MNVVIPDDPRALAAYEAGKEYYYTRRGQLEFACENCHMQSAGILLRADRLSGMLGQATHCVTCTGKRRRQLLLIFDLFI